MKYKCLILDHDDTVVDSTRQIHYPCFVEFVKKYRPNYCITFEEYMLKNFSPGFLQYFIDELKFSRMDLVDEEKYWNNYVQNHIPRAYEGIREILNVFQKKGGMIFVCSHSMMKNIIRDYKANQLPLPDEIFGWERSEEERKPSPFTIFEVEKKYAFKRKEILVVDDLKPGYDMAQKCGVDFAAAAWGYQLPEINVFMKKYSKYYLEHVRDLAKVLFDE